MTPLNSISWMARRAGLAGRSCAMVRRSRPALHRIARRAAASVVLSLALAARPPTGQSAETTILSEDFEGVFPSAIWTVGDLNPNGVEAYVDLSGYGGAVRTLQFEFISDA